MQTSQAGVDLIKAFESLRNAAYLDAVKVWTVGYGHTGPDVVEGTWYTSQQAEVVLKKDLAKFEEAVKRLINIELNQYQFDALVSFTFNVGAGALEASTLRKRLNNGEDPSVVAKEELPRWNKGDKGRTLEGLTRRRMQEVELFCAAPPKPLAGNVTITALKHTLLKKEPIPSEQLSSDKRAKVMQSRVIRNCTVLEHKNKHTYLELGFGLGRWWVYDEHWSGLTTQAEIKPYAVQGDLHYLRNFPYFYQQDNGAEGWRQCQTSCIAMCLKYLDVPGIKDDVDYLKYVNKHGDTTHREPHKLAIAELGAYARFSLSVNIQDIKDEIDKGLPVVAGILHHGTIDHPTGNGHFVVISGYGKDYWLVQDPYGDLDLVGGSWVNTGPAAGKNIHYSFKNLNPRLFVGGDGNGWCWLNFKKNRNDDA
jgi:GH24 family phage-related lysozyme (muramidase)